MDWILDRLSERSTWMGLVSALTAIGVGISPEQTAAIVSAGVAVGGLVAAITQD